MLYDIVIFKELTKHYTSLRQLICAKKDINAIPSNSPQSHWFSKFQSRLRDNFLDPYSLTTEETPH